MSSTNTLDVTKQKHMNFKEIAASGNSRSSEFISGRV